MRGALILLAALLLGAALAPQQPVPFFDTPELTPRWRTTHHRVGPFRLLDHTGKVVTEADLDGHPTVVRFFFSRCSSLCPRLTENLARVPGVPVFSVSVLPEDDTPEWLARYHRERGYPASWRLLTGEAEAIHRLARESLFCGAEDFRRTNTGREILHSEKLFLIDGQRRLRGVYNGSQALECEHLAEDAKLVNTPAREWLPGL